MNIELNTRIPLEPGKVYFMADGESEYQYAPCDMCDGTGKVEIKGKGTKIRCPECGGENSMKYRTVGSIQKFRVAKYRLKSICFDSDGKVISAHFVRADKSGCYGETLYTGEQLNNLPKMEIWGEPLSEDYGDVLKEVKRKNKLERESKKDE